jgi:uncharacterized protein YndB with AHSA1/START domain
MTSSEEKITVAVKIKLPVEKVWELWTMPQHIIHWNNASEDWQTSRAENDLRVGGKFLFHMEAKDGSVGFDFSGEYNSILKHKFIGYMLDDNRSVSIIFAQKGNETEVSESFDPENVYPAELQKAGWQSILNNFKKYAESSVSSLTN